LSVNEDSASQVDESKQVLDVKFQEKLIREYFDNLHEKYMNREGRRLLAEKGLEETQQRTKEVQQRVTTAEASDTEKPLARRRAPFCG